MQKQIIMEDILKQCNEFCNESYSRFIAEYKMDKKETEEVQRKARKYAIKQTFRTAMEKYKNISPSYIWKRINIAHIYFYSKMEIDPSVVEMILSARQSWVKSSGHAFEETLKEDCNRYLNDTDICLLLQKDVTALIQKNKLSNYSQDVEWLKIECESNVFDLFVALKQDNGFYKVFGCVQAKTSVRDRVTRDREPSIRAMEKKFWSIIIILDAEFLHQPKFVAMVNGGNQEFEENGWHTAYTYEEGFNNDRIRYMGKDLQNFVEDIKKAKEAFNGEMRALVTTKYPHI